VAKARTFQDLILTLQSYCAAHGCLILQPYDNGDGGGRLFTPPPPCAPWAAPLERAFVSTAAVPRRALWRDPTVQQYPQFRLI